VYLKNETLEEMQIAPASFLATILHELAHVKNGDSAIGQVLYATLPREYTRGDKRSEGLAYKEATEYIADIQEIIENDFTHEQRLFIYKGRIKSFIKEIKSDFTLEESWSLTPSGETHPRHTNRLQLLARAYQLCLNSIKNIAK
jgi:hypothetical protein